MNGERLLQWLIALLATLSSTMLGMGSGNLTLPVLTLFAAFTSLYMTDRAGWFYLRGSWASLAAICAVSVSIYDFFDLQRDRQLLAIAFLLVYLQVVLLYQRKTERIYWQLQLLSILQVVVASALNFGLDFGLLLLVYLFFCLWTGFVFFVVRQQKHQWVLGFSSSPPSLETHFSAEAVTQSQTAHFHPRLALAALRHASAICVLAFLTFLLLPRMGGSSSHREEVGGRMIGFTETVRLGELGTAIENEQPVLRIWFYAPNESEPFRLIGPPMLRGAIVNHYQNGTWSVAGSPLWDRDVEVPQAEANTTQQRIILSPLREQTVFAVYPPAIVDPQTPIAFNLRNRQLVRTVSPTMPLDLVLATNGIRYTRQLQLTPADRLDSLGTASLLQPFESAATESPATLRLAAVKRLAEEILADEEDPLEGTIKRAEALCAYLRNSPRFGYTLAAEDRDTQIDPVVDFLTENPRGHCEYFSTALTLMLRSVGIRARMVIGFQGGDWNPLGGYYQIRQRDAHSWTEAYIPADEISGMPGGGWLRLDPTPSTFRFDRGVSGGPAMQLYRQMRNYAEFLWAKYVIQLDARRQREDIYHRLAGWALRLSESAGLQGTNDAQRDGESLASETEQADSRANSEWWWWLGRWTLGGLLLLAGLWLVRRLYRAGLTGGQELSANRSPIPRRPFYRRWERLLARYLPPRPPEQTPRQHAAVIAAWLAERGLAAEQEIPFRLVDAHYAYAFGGHPPAAETEAELTAAVLDLGTALAALPRTTHRAADSSPGTEHSKKRMAQL